MYNSIPTSYDGMQILYTNTHGYSAYSLLYTCTCMYVHNTWVRHHHCDQPVGSGGQVAPKKQYDSSSARYTDKSGEIVET